MLLRNKSRWKTMFNKFRCVYLLPFIMYSGALFSASVTGVSPLVGPKAGGTAVTITGSGFTGATQVSFGPTLASSFVVNSDTTIIATAPASVPSDVDIIVTAPSGVSTANPADIFTYQGSWFAYVGTPSITGGGVGPIDLSTNTAQPKIPVGVNGAPLDVEITPDNHTAIAADVGNNTIVFIDLATSTVTSTIPAVGTGIQFLAISPDGRFAYVTCSTSATVDVVDIINPSHPITTSIALPSGSQPFTAVFSPDGKRVYVLGDSLFTIDTSTNTVIATLAFATPPGSNTDMAITPNGNFLIVTNAATNRASIISTATNTVVNTIAVGPTPSVVAVTPDGLRAYVGNFNGNTLTRINLTTFVAELTFGAVTRPNGLAITPDGKALYVSSSIAVGSVVPFDITTNPETQGTAIAGFRFPVAISITPDQSPVARFTASLSKTGTPSSFDASQSVSPVGSISSYAWNFGDGTTVTTASPVIQHTYQKAGQFHVTLTVTNTAGTSTTQLLTSRTLARNGSLYFAVRDISLGILLSSPSKFIGEIQKVWDKKIRSHILKLHTSWKKPSQTEVSHYEIFAGNKRIKKISLKHHRRFVKHLHPSSFMKTHRHHYKKFLDRRYKIRAVNSDGISSNFTHLKIRK